MPYASPDACLLLMLSMLLLLLLLWLLLLPLIWMHRTWIPRNLDAPMPAQISGCSGLCDCCCC